MPFGAWNLPSPAALAYDPVAGYIDTSPFRTFSGGVSGMVSSDVTTQDKHCDVVIRGGGVFDGAGSPA